MKIAFFGTPEFAWNILSGILEYSEIECKLVVSQPDKQIWRKKELQHTPVKQIALDAKIEVIQPEEIKKNVEFHKYLKLLDLDFIVVVAYGKIIPQAILDIPKYGCINLHGSLLPKYRGASPVQAAIKAGETETWLTTMYMSKGMDEWDILLQAKVDIDIVDISPDIFKKFVHIGPELLVRTLREVISGDLVWIPQDDTLSTHCGKISREDGEVFFQKQACKEIYDTYRAYTPWPGIFTYYEGKRFVLEEVMLHRTTAHPVLQKQDIPLYEREQIESPSSREMSVGQRELSWVQKGHFIKLTKNRYGIICSDQELLEILSVKLEGKKSVDITSFVNGNRDIIGYVFP